MIGVLALQGDFAKHLSMLHNLGIETKEVRTSEELESCDGLIIPGGESTVILRQLNFIKMKDNLCEFAKKKPVFGTCAGLILMSNQVQQSSMQPLKLLNIDIERNAFGRQVASFEASVELYLEPKHPKIFHAFFIRAPRIRASGPHIQVLATYQGEPILVREGHHLGASFHPELTTDPTIHRYFIEMIRKQKSARDFQK